mgnify:FL=1
MQQIDKEYTFVVVNIYGKTINWKFTKKNHMIEIMVLQKDGLCKLNFGTFYEETVKLQIR